MGISDSHGESLRLLAADKYGFKVNTFFGGGIEVDNRKRVSFTDFGNVTGNYPTDLPSYVTRLAWKNRINEFVESEDSNAGVLMVMDRMWMMEGKMNANARSGHFPNFDLSIGQFNEACRESFGIGPVNELREDFEKRMGLVLAKDIDADYMKKLGIGDNVKEWERKSTDERMRVIYEQLNSWLLREITNYNKVEYSPQKSENNVSAEKRVDRVDVGKLLEGVPTVRSEVYDRYRGGVEAEKSDRSQLEKFDRMVGWLWKNGNIKLNSNGLSPELELREDDINSLTMLGWLKEMVGNWHKGKGEERLSFELTKGVERWGLNYMLAVKDEGVMRAKDKFGKLSIANNPGFILELGPILLEETRRMMKDQIREQYRKLSARYHPDINEAGENTAKRLNGANDTLKDEESFSKAIRAR